MKKIILKYYTRVKILFTKAYLISLVIAFVLWTLIKFSGTFKENFHIKIQLKNIPQTHILASNNTKDITIQVRASGFRLLLLRLSSYSFKEISFKDLKHVSEDLYTWRIPLKNTSLFPKYINNIALEILSDPLLKFSIIEKKLRKVKVIPTFNIKKNSGLLIDSFSINPEYVQVYFNDNEDTATSIKTLPIEITDIKNKVDIEFNTNKNWIWKKEKPNFKTFLSIDKYTEKEIRFNLEHPNSKIKIFPASTVLKISTPSKKFNQFNENSFQFSFSEIDTNNLHQKLQLELIKKPIYTTVLSIKPKEVDYILFKENE